MHHIPTQPKLLRVLQEGEFEPLGTARTATVAVRVVAATQRDLKQMTAEGKSREDVCFRLNIFPTHIPPLRERGSDVEQSAAAFAQRYARRLGERIGPPTEEQLKRLRGYDWPGNVRELQNVIERAMILTSDGELQLERALAAFTSAPGAAACVGEGSRGTSPRGQMNPVVLNTAGEPERELRSRRWNAIEALGLAGVAFASAWLLACGVGTLGGQRWARDFGGAPLYAILVFALFVSPRLHGDAAESWGLGSPSRLARLLRAGRGARRWATLAAVALLFGGLTWLGFAQWPRLARVFQLPGSVAHWRDSLPGAGAALAISAGLAAFLVTCAVRYDNFGPAFRAALKVSAALVGFAFLAAVAQRGWPVVREFEPGRFALGVLGYFFWGYFQQLIFCAWFGTRLRKAFGPAASPPRAATVTERARRVTLAGLAATAALAPLAWGAVRAARGPDAATLSLLGWLAAFAFPVGATWGWFFLRDRQRLLVATLSGSFFGLIHIDSYGLVLVTWLLGTILAWLFMEDRTRNIAALGFIHGFLGTSFGLLFNSPEAGALRVSYHVGPWNVQAPTAAVLIIPALCCGFYAALAVWCARRLRD